MKRIAIFVTVLAGAFGAQAQDNQKLERAGFLRDSVANVLAEHRAKYGKNEALREELTPVILSLEKEIVRLQAEYEKELAVISQRDAKTALNAYAEALKEAAEKAAQGVVDHLRRDGRELFDRIPREGAIKDFSQRIKVGNFIGAEVFCFRIKSRSTGKRSLFSQTYNQSGIAQFGFAVHKNYVIRFDIAVNHSG